MKNGNCPPGFGHNEDDRCIPIGKGPEGCGRLDDDETASAILREISRHVRMVM